MMNSQRTFGAGSAPAPIASSTLNSRGNFVADKKRRSETPQASRSTGSAASGRDSSAESRDSEGVVYTRNPMLIDRHGTAPSTISGMNSAEEHFKRFAGQNKFTGQSIDSAVERSVENSNRHDDINSMSESLQAIFICKYHTIVGKSAMSSFFDNSPVT